MAQITTQPECPKPRSRRGWSLRTGLMIYVVLPMCLLLFSALWWALRGFEKQVELQMQRDLELVAEAMQGPLSHAMLREREGSIGEALKAAFDLSEVYGAFLYDAKGNRIVPDEDSRGELDREEVTDVAEAGRARGEYTEMYGREVYSHFLPITDAAGNISGLLQLTRRRSDFVETLNSLRLRVGLFSGLGIVAVFGIMMLGHYQAAGKDINALARSMSIVSTGDRSHRHPPGGSRETSALAEHFNRMLDAMDTAEQEIKLRRQSERELEERLRHSEKLAAIGELAAGVAHELGTPLSVIDARAQRLERKPQDEEAAARSAVSIRKETARMQTIIRQLLDFSRRQPGQWGEVDIESLINSAAEAVEEERKRCGGSLILNPPDPGITTQGDRDRLQQALVNLLNNALQADPGGEIEIRAERDGQHCRLSVRDRGPGVDPDIRNKLTEPFFTTKSVGEGTGLGLSVVHGIVTEHSGELEIESEPGSGSVFTLKLPLPDGEETA